MFQNYPKYVEKVTYLAYDHKQTDSLLKKNLRYSGLLNNVQAILYDDLIPPNLYNPISTEYEAYDNEKKSRTWFVDTLFSR